MSDDHATNSGYKNRRIGSLEQQIAVSASGSEQCERTAADGSNSPMWQAASPSLKSWRRKRICPNVAYTAALGSP